jgi:hypothetical protein
MIPFIFDNFNAGIGNFCEWVIDETNQKSSSNLSKSVDYVFSKEIKKSEMAYNVKAVLYNIATTFSIACLATSFFNPSALISFGMYFGVAYLIHEAMLRTFIGMQMHVGNNKYAPFKPFIIKSGSSTETLRQFDRIQKHTNLRLKPN